jgi:UDP-glucose 4-epimerase
MTDPQKYCINNLAGTLTLLETMRNAGCPRLVFSANGAFYGSPPAEGGWARFVSHAEPIRRSRSGL